MISDARRHFGPKSRIADIVKDEERAHRVAKALVDSGAYHIDPNLVPEQYFAWKSGIKAPCYCNCRDLLGPASYRLLVGSELAASVKERFHDVNAVIGIATAGIAWAALVADQLECQLAYVRGEKKTHGLGGFVQGTLTPDSRVVVIDDLVASGGSLLSAVAAIESEAHATVVGIQTIVNWGFEKMREKLIGVEYTALTSYPHILTAAMSRGLVSPSDMERFLEFYENPSRGFVHA